MTTRHTTTTPDPRMAAGPHNPGACDACGEYATHRTPLHYGEAAPAMVCAGCAPEEEGSTTPTPGPYAMDICRCSLGVAGHERTPGCPTPEALQATVRRLRGYASRLKTTSRKDRAATRYLRGLVLARMDQRTEVVLMSRLAAWAAIGDIRDAGILVEAVTVSFLVVGLRVWGDVAERSQARRILKDHERAARAWVREGDRTQAQRVRTERWLMEQEEQDEDDARAARSAEAQAMDAGEPPIVTARDEYRAMASLSLKAGLVAMVAAVLLLVLTMAGPRVRTEAMVLLSMVAPMAVVVGGSRQDRRAQLTLRAREAARHVATLLDRAQAEGSLSAVEVEWAQERASLAWATAGVPSEAAAWRRAADATREERERTSGDQLQGSSLRALTATVAPDPEPQPTPRFSPTGTNLDQTTEALTQARFELQQATKTPSGNPSYSKQARMEPTFRQTVKSGVIWRYRPGFVYAGEYRGWTIVIRHVPVTNGWRLFVWPVA